MVSAAPPVLRLEEFIPRLSADGWTVCVIATPTAASWVDLDALAAETGCVTRVHPRPPRQKEKSLPRADVILAAPLTFNSVNKWAAGISDTFALGVFNEMLGTEVPIVAAPCIKPALRRHPAYADSIARLTKAGVTLLDPDTITTRAEDGLANFDWSYVVSALHSAVTSDVDR
ncbi:flavoprotein [Amycolatopsis umgeniensis]|uniref:Phosphopantothenoylcysteine synthetase/decarboxylase n=1 Tax=Amycolatopsis umgeniensis TaxID=336628 RepID=A0A841B5U2_9PSEU|nr:phosphopantothenoylcysteine synthetase/decarboxylase [Amycolatopsis umgeniensis]